jgi:hypothetical protein
MLLSQRYFLLGGDTNALSIIGAIALTCDLRCSQFGKVISQPQTQHTELPLIHNLNAAVPCRAETAEEAIYRFQTH